MWSPCSAASSASVASRARPPHRRRSAARSSGRASSRSRAPRSSDRPSRSTTTASCWRGRPSRSRSPGPVLSDALAGAGIGLRLLEQIETDDGVISAGLELTIDQSLPNSASPARAHDRARSHRARSPRGPGSEDPGADGAEGPAPGLASADVGSAPVALDLGSPALSPASPDGAAPSSAVLASDGIDRRDGEHRPRRLLPRPGCRCPHGTGQQRPVPSPGCEVTVDPMKYAREQWDRVGAIVLVLIGGLLLLFGWLGVRDTAYPAEQVPYVVSGGLGGDRPRRHRRGARGSRPTSATSGARSIGSRTRSDSSSSRSVTPGPSEKRRRPPTPRRRRERRPPT